MTDQPQELPQIAADDYVAPVLMREAFHCMYCGVYTRQSWSALVEGRTVTTRVRKCRCFNCRKDSFWLARDPGYAREEDPSAPMLWPFGSALAPTPHAEMPDDVRADYDEARGIVDRSPRGAAALLRLAVQKLAIALGEKGDNLNDDIASLVKRGLPEGVQQALDALRVIGNNAVHPGELDLRDDRDTAVSLFSLLNFIIDQQIAEPKRLSRAYALLPERARQAIERRDSE
jgi:hypothetical protein